MPALQHGVENEVANWLAARQALRVAKNLLSEDPRNGALQTRLLQATQTAEEAHLALKAAVREYGLTPEQLQAHVKRLSLPS